MPKFDGTGPAGMGAGTGRGMGPCGSGFGRGYGGRFGCRRFLTKTEELEALKEESEMMEAELKAIKEKIEEMGN
jgi:hypothetical protein